MKTSPTGKKVRELISMVKEGKLIPKPEFQRRLVWSRDDKNHFIDTILRGYPFPEIYFADGDVDLESGEGTQLLVDGLQRVSTLIQYFEGDSSLRITTVPAYADLSGDRKRDFLQYDVAVRDLGSISKEEVIEIFKRLNATKYSLKDIEVNNALYAGALKTYCENLAQRAFFIEHNVFSVQDFKRMGDLRYTLSIIGTMLHGYFNRDDEFEELLSRYNDDFQQAAEIDERANTVISFIEECGFDAKSRVWKKADLFTLFCEIDDTLNIRVCALAPSVVVSRIGHFYERVESAGANGPDIYSIYYKASIQATNDRINRVRRGLIICGVLQGLDESQILTSLRDRGL